MSITNLLKTVAQKERCDSVHNAALALQLIDPSKQGIVSLNFHFIVAGAQMDDESIKAVTLDMVARVKTFEAELRAAYPGFVFIIDGDAAGLKAEFDSPEHRAQFETENAEQLAEAKAKANVLASETGGAVLAALGGEESIEA